ncbi:bystin [Anaeramoeba ignava]|uniref:Bystin n=1 Tax=Anaeramoeba ignava TaxID=1746090 RepID=A0A9Q0LH18_ANAIG|nr:bystin [Anaeramoeba ignava]
MNQKKKKNFIEDKNNRLSLEQQILEDKQIKKKKRQKRKSETNEKKETKFLNQEISQEIISQAKNQDIDEKNDNQEIKIDQKEIETNQQFSDTEEYELNFEEDQDFEEDEQLDIQPEDAEIFDRFIKKNKQNNSDENTENEKNLVDIILQKIHEKESHEQNQKKPKKAKGMNRKVIQVYSKIGEILKNYRSGKLPKAFNVIPALERWEEVIELTHPESWSPQAIRAATTIFVSSTNSQASADFFEIVLLPYIRDQLKNNKKLNLHLYEALKKALYRPAAFYKGVLFPLCESKTCTFREASIIGSVILHKSIPVLYSSAALLRLSQIDYSPGTIYFIKCILSKKYALPIRVINSLAGYFSSFSSQKEDLPVLWHQTLLLFVQSYKNDLTVGQKEAFFFLLRKKKHHLITQEIRRELQNAVPREEEEKDDLDQQINQILSLSKK